VSVEGLKDVRRVQVVDSDFSIVKSEDNRVECESIRTDNKVGVRVKALVIAGSSSSLEVNGILGLVVAGSSSLEVNGILGEIETGSDDADMSSVVVVDSYDGVSSSDVPDDVTEAVV
jgi:hypothetical protein